jgi:hypothetical protein
MQKILRRCGARVHTWDFPKTASMPLEARSATRAGGIPLWEAVARMLARRDGVAINETSSVANCPSFVSTKFPGIIFLVNRAYLFIYALFILMSRTPQEAAAMTSFATVPDGSWVLAARSGAASMQCVALAQSPPLSRAGGST